MRYILFFLLINHSSAFSQNLEQTSQERTKQTILETKWYLNAVIISELGWNDTSTLITSVPSKNFIQFSDRMKFGRDGETAENSKSIFKYYRLIMDDSISGTIQVYDTKKNFRKDENAEYYSIEYNASQFLLGTNEPTIDPLKDLGGTRTYIFSRNIDSEQLTTNVLGSWVLDSAQNILLVPVGKEITLRKTSTRSIHNVGDSYYFGLYDGEMICLSACFRLPKVEPNLSENIHVGRSRGYAPDPYYVNHNYTEPLKFAVDIQQRLLILFQGNNPVYFEILGVTNDQLLLKKR